jgi:hypothetical protein
MVLSGTKKTSSMSSLVNINQGGGMKKAGLVPTETVSVAQRRAYGGTQALVGAKGGFGSNGRAGLMNLLVMQKPKNSTRYVPGSIGMRFSN